MRVGERIDGRFVLEAEVASGGMGRVLRARDEATGDWVAIKLTIRLGPSDLGRFERECRALAGLQHPGIVRYVAHGILPDGAPYLAMEWLEGLDLAGLLRARRGPQTMAATRGDGPVAGAAGVGGLTVREVVTLGIRAAAALGELHRAGIVHRDVKPGNLFLPEGTVDNVKLVDLGTVRVSGAARDMTQTGAVIGTPQYMAPEQARGDADVGPASDVFSLGCVLYECLAGRTPFYAEQFVAVLGRILLDEPERIDRHRGDVPPALLTLVRRMLAKEIGDRLATGEAVVTELVPIRDTLPPGESGEVFVRASPFRLEEPRTGPITIGTDERRIQSVLWARSTDPATPLDLRAVEQLGGIVTRLAGGAVLVSVQAGAGPLDQAARIARLALALRQSCPTAAVSIATSPMTNTSDVDLARRADAALAGARGGTIGLDTVSRALVDPAFTVAAGAGALELTGEREVVGLRLLLGKPTRLCGRKKEISLLTATLDEAIEESIARAIVVTGPAGQGKSRLRHEVERILGSRDDIARVLYANGEPASAASPYALLAPALLRAAGVTGRDGPEVRARKIHTLAAVVPPESRARVAAFLGEMCGVPVAPEGDEAMRAARGDPALYVDQLRAAFEELLVAESRSGAVVLVLDNLHWGDGPSVRAVLGALRALVARPFLVFALARPEARGQFPELFAEQALVELRLDPLSPRAASDLVRDALGPGASDTLVGGIVSRSGGNAFYLEELVRAVAEGSNAEAHLPETVLGMVQARLSALGPEARRVLRAGSVLGEVMWSGAVQRMLGSAALAFGVDDWLDTLVAKEVLLPVKESRFGGQRELRFVHAIVRDAAYAMLTDEDRAGAHLVAAGWLREVGETDPVVLAHHARAGGDRPLAVRELSRAAAHALERNDPIAAMARGREAIDVGATDEVRGECASIVAVACAWAGDYEACIIAAEEASSLVRQGSAAHFAALGASLRALAARGKLIQFERVLSAVLDQDPEPGAEAAQIDAVTKATAELVLEGRLDRADRALAVVARGRAHGIDARLEGEALGVLALRASVVAEIEKALGLFERAVLAFERAGDARSAAIHRANVGRCLGDLGAWGDAEAAARDALARGVAMRSGPVVARAQLALGLVLRARAVAGREAEAGAWLAGAEAALEAARVAFAAAHENRLAGWAVAASSAAALARGDHEAAERHAVEAQRLLVQLPTLRAWATALRARSILRSARPNEAIEAARTAWDFTLAAGGLLCGDALPGLVLAEVLEAQGDGDGARAIALRARDRLRARAASIGDADRRAGYLQTRDVADTLELAQRLAAPP